MKPDHKVGRLTLLHPTGQGSLQKWLCRCDCGTLKSIWASNLRQGRTQSCGCLRKEIKNSVMASAFPSQGVMA
jgi:hypothetical protein